MGRASAGRTAAAGAGPVWRPVIKVVGIGGAGINAINRMVRHWAEGVELVALDADSQLSHASLAPTQLALEQGGSAVPDATLSDAAMEAVRQALRGADVVFVLAGMGGATGTRVAPGVARLAREAGALTIGVITEPFTFERSRLAAAGDGMAGLTLAADMVVAIPADELLAAMPGSTVPEACQSLDQLMDNAVRAIMALLTPSGLVVPDFADVCAYLRGGGLARLGIGRGQGADRAQQAARAALVCPFLGPGAARASCVLLYARVGPDLAMIELVEAVECVSGSIAPEATVLVGADIDPELGEAMELTLIIRVRAEEEN